MSIVVYSTTILPITVGGYIRQVPWSYPILLSPSPVRLAVLPQLPRPIVVPPRASLIRYFVYDPWLTYVGPYPVTVDQYGRVVYLTPAQAVPFLGSFVIGQVDFVTLPYPQRQRIWQLSGRRVPPDRPSVVHLPLTDQSCARGSPFTYTFPNNTFTNPDNPSPNYVYKAKLASGGPLPSWLLFNTLARTFLGTPPAGFPGTFPIVVYATDQFGRVYQDGFVLTVT